MHVLKFNQKLYYDSLLTANFHFYKCLQKQFRKKEKFATPTKFTYIFPFEAYKKLDYIVLSNNIVKAKIKAISTVEYDNCKR